jgi:TRAP-type C4-dicarboxylate transport system permease small subunit
VSATDAQGGGGFTRAARTAIAGWAIAGGFLLLAVVAINMFTVIGSMFGSPFPGDFELTEIGVAIAAFTFLPWCQLNGANVTADIFTANASPRKIAFLQLLASLVAGLFAALLIWRMYLGMLDQKQYDYVTAILQVPIWLAFLPILVSLALLVVAALVTIGESFRAMRLGGGR